MISEDRESARFRYFIASGDCFQRLVVVVRHDIEQQPVSGLLALTGGGSFRTVPVFTGPRCGCPERRLKEDGLLSRSSTACRKLMPSARITQSMTVPPALQAPKTVPEILPRRDNERRIAVIVERAEAQHRPRAGAA